MCYPLALAIPQVCPPLNSSASILSASTTTIRATTTTPAATTRPSTAMANTTTNATKATATTTTPIPPCTPTNVGSSSSLKRVVSHIISYTVYISKISKAFRKNRFCARLL
ncbi:unnamed protein product [Rotaria sordida]|uniref:Uncharacterized protein n=1 Tax=Rotaria sordida TaxID=392033 RepID=A0A815BI07_9BILA|nr:unnamed protein product [Rotaria sordida]CAF1547506.1 unnamed protein product [Rotaria sordida]